MDRDRLLGDLRIRFDRLAAGDHGAVLEDGALATMRRLLPLAIAFGPMGRQRAVDEEAVMEIGFLHWYRYLVRPEPDGVPDFRDAVERFSLLHRQPPGVVPSPLREYLAAIGDRQYVRAQGAAWQGPATTQAGRLPAETDPAAFAASLGLLESRLVPGVERCADYGSRLGLLGRAYLTAALRGNPQFLDDAVHFLVTAATHVPTGSADWTEVQAAAGTALVVRAQTGPARADLEAATAHFLSALSHDPRSPSAPIWLTNLGFAEMRLYDLTAMHGYLTRAIDHLTAALNRTPQQQAACVRENLRAALSRQVMVDGGVTDHPAGAFVTNATVLDPAVKYPHSRTGQ